MKVMMLSGERDEKVLILLRGGKIRTPENRKR